MPGFTFPSTYGGGTLGPSAPPTATTPAEIYQQIKDKQTAAEAGSWTPSDILQWQLKYAGGDPNTLKALASGYGVQIAGSPNPGNADFGAALGNYQGPGAYSTKDGITSFSPLGSTQPSPAGGTGGGTPAGTPSGTPGGGAGGSQGWWNNYLNQINYGFNFNYPNFANQSMEGF